MNRIPGAFLRLMLASVVVLGMVTMTRSVAATGDQDRETPVDTEWRYAGNGPEKQYYSPLAQINDKTVRRLGLAWSVDLPTKDGPVGNVLVADGIAYESAAGGRVFAVDLKTGKLAWQFTPTLHFAGSALPAIIGARAQRGLALDGDRLFITLPDCRLATLDARTGRVLWEKQTCDRTAGFTQTGPPETGRGLVYVGNSCMDSGGRRGFVTALDQTTGEQRWMFRIVPAFPEVPSGGQENAALEMAAKTWGTNVKQQQVGCGGSYGGMTFDPELNQLYVSTSGAFPWSPSERGSNAGEELFAGSILALDAETGEYKWHYKLAPNDGWNWEAFQSLVADLVIAGKPRRVVMNVPKHGFFIMLDAGSGEFISAVQAADVNWASGFDAKGRPILTGIANYWEKGPEGAVVMPGPSGSHNWQPMAFNPNTGLVYVPTGNLPTHMALDPTQVYGGSTMESYYEDATHRRSGQLVAIDPAGGKIRWQAKRELTYNGGVLSTGGNLVIEGTGAGFLEVRAADTGKLLWKKYLGGSLLGAPSTVMFAGEQYVILPYGNSNSGGIAMNEVLLTSCDECRFAVSRLLAFKLDGKAVLPDNPKPPAREPPPLARFDESSAARGKQLYNANACEMCHGLNLVNGGGTTPDLTRTGAARHGLFTDIVRDGILNPAGMPRFSYLSDDDLKALQAYIINGAWDAYDAERHRTGSLKPVPRQQSQ